MRTSLADRSIVLSGTHSFEVVDGHIVAILGGHRCLVDTGSPLSFGSPPALLVGRAVVPLVPVGFGLAIDAVADFVGTKLDALLGADALASSVLTVHWDEHRLRFGKRRASKERWQRFDLVGGVPVFHLGLGPMSVRAVFDSGAKLSYLSSDAFSGSPMQALGAAPDFHPSIGRYATETGRTRIRVAGRLVEHTFGCLPVRLGALIRGVGAHAIVGTSIFESARSVTLDYPRRRLAFSWR